MDNTKNVTIMTMEDSDIYPYFYYLCVDNRQDSEEADNIDFQLYEDGYGDFVGFDSVLDVVEYAKKNGLNLTDTDEEIQAYIKADFSAFGDNLAVLTETAIDELNEYPKDRLMSVEGIKKAYTEVVSNLYRIAEERRGVIEEEIDDLCRYNPDYKEAKEQYFEYAISSAEKLIRHFFEETHAHEIGHAYLDSDGKSEHMHYSIVEDTYEYDNGLMLIVYDFTDEEYTQALENGAVQELEDNAQCAHYCIDLDELHAEKNDIPKEFWADLYDVPADFTKDKNKEKCEIGRE